MHVGCESYVVFAPAPATGASRARQVAAARLGAAAWYSIAALGAQ